MIFFFFAKGTARRKKKVVHRTATADDKKLQFSLKKLGVNNISGIEEVIASKKRKIPYIDRKCIKINFLVSSTGPELVCKLSVGLRGALRTLIYC